MANHHMTDKGPIPFTAEEEIKWAEKEVIADKKHKEEMEEYDKNKYQRDRKLEYPSIEDVTVALAEKAEGDSTMWDEITVKRQATKDKYPKE